VAGLARANAVTTVAIWPNLLLIGESLRVLSLLLLALGQA
jgi:hypothetical protein